MTRQLAKPMAFRSPIRIGARATPRYILDLPFIEECQE
jgi:hypothetical protein